MKKIHFPGSRKPRLRLCLNQINFFVQPESKKVKLPQIITFAFILVFRYIISCKLIFLYYTTSSL